MQIEAYVFFNGNCEEAFTFYQSAVGGELHLSRYEGSPMEDQVGPELRDKIIHASLRFDGGTLMGADGIGEWQRKIGNNFALSLVSKDEPAARSTFSKLAAGGKVTMELSPTFWGAKLFGMLTDKFGVDWMVSVYE
jgi:PhnB protein